MSRPAGQEVVGLVSSWLPLPFSLLLDLDVYVTTTGFHLGSGDQTQFLVPVWQELYSLSHFISLLGLCFWCECILMLQY